MDLGKKKKKILGLLAQLLGKWQVLVAGAGIFCLLQEPGWSSWQHIYPFLDLQEISLWTLLVISRHVFICRCPKILGWRGRVHGAALHPVATGLVFLTYHLLAFSRQAIGRKNITLGPLFVAAREGRDSGKAEKAWIHHKQNSRMSKIWKRTLKELIGLP